MRLGRVPVVISDEWVDPPNVPWAECMIRIAERDIERLPDILRAREAEWPAMAAKAREVFDANFSIKAAIVWIDTAIRQIAAARSPETDRFSFTRATREAARRNLLHHWFREVVRVKTGERTVFMAPQNEWVLPP